MRSGPDCMVVRRLEDRAQIPRFAEIRENYLSKIGLPLAGRILELGCGTGAVSRAIASRPGFIGTVVGSDLSAKLIEAAKDITAQSGLKNIEYCQADGQGARVHDRARAAGGHTRATRRGLLSRGAVPEIIDSASSPPHGRQRR